MTFKLNELKPNPGSTRKKIRVGRGIGSGKGKTSGRGGKGQTARSGVAINGFEGGQTPIHRRLPKRGFNNHTRKEFEVLNLSDLQKAVNDKKISASSAITFDVLKKAGLVKGRLDGIKILGSGEISAKLNISVDKASASGVKAIEAAGGKVSFVKASATTAAANTEEQTASAKPAKKAAKPKAEKKAPAKSKKE